MSNPWARTPRSFAAAVKRACDGGPNSEFRVITVERAIHYTGADALPAWRSAGVCGD